jgi:uncharacterized protein (TIGR00270 family)
MADCEVCGRDAPLYIVDIDKARLSVCVECAKSGKIIKAPQAAPEPKSKDYREQRQAKPEFDLVADYGSKIRKAREKMHITMGVLGEMINEKESFLDRVEREKVLPTEALAKKLERALGIRLFEEISAASGFSRHEQKGLTLGDVIKIKRKGEKGEEA